MEHYRYLLALTIDTVCQIFITWCQSPLRGVNLSMFI